MCVENFKKEYASLRRSFREDEYATIAAANPATNIFGQAFYAAGGAVVKAFAAADKALEEAGVLPALAVQARSLVMHLAAIVYQPESGLQDNSSGAMRP